MNKQALINIANDTKTPRRISAAIYQAISDEDDAPELLDVVTELAAMEPYHPIKDFWKIQAKARAALAKGE